MEKKITQNSVGKHLWLNTLLATSILGLGISATPIAAHAEDINNTVQITSPDTYKTKDTNLNATVTNNDDGSQTIKIELPANKVKGNDQKLNFVATDIDADSDGSQEHQTVDSGKIQRKNDNISFKVNLSSTALSNKTLMTDPLKITLLNSKGETIATIEGITLEELQDMAKNNASDTSSMIAAASSSNLTATTSDKTDSSSNASSSAVSSENKANNLSTAPNMNPNGSTEASLANNTVTSTTSQASSAATPATASSSAASIANMRNSSANSVSSSSAETSGSSSPANSSSNPNSASSANASSASSSPASENSQSKADQALPQTGNTNQFYLTIAGVVILAGAIGAYVGLKTRKK
ncbi:LPXTG cell wall anchor domain-containing protein [Limosilactobacillus reuteri]|uniref:LPXTG cell wall anchor domain-containing protein n=1 Tax=Limosilactobacillus reuteri TaxID=1598 RepID=UPI001E34F6F3|nr:LPXTG cell wall anchor domain-containing protein [Limosilactobacillus reuteri]MCC4466042.1 LPXTG cell wall anchor domain-containing protein [Limosilactobacillus reuteri]MCC4472235.1 LPXTG cell wall anchor domain-containing protein [Limosilactobacillus reuteri]MCT3189077.1 LPXTG cell wall anchor domain-containing protein [Limosilactobacillus reuteri]MCT3197580.1 LPXTG cell wall anchor domain-containing protein [Limosilactobacillus reuteri]UNL41533.1 LPXTG cell wall anchor domain-containing p